MTLPIFGNPEGQPAHVPEGRISSRRWLTRMFPFDSVVVGGGDELLDVNVWGWPPPGDVINITASSSAGWIEKKMIWRSVA